MNTAGEKGCGRLNSGWSRGRLGRWLGPWVCLLLMAGCLLPVAGWAARVEKDVQEPAEGAKDQPSVAVKEEVRVRPEPGFRMPEGPGKILPRDNFRLRIWTDRKEYRDGAPVRVYFRVTRDAYVYLFDRDTHGVSRQLFPNYYDQENYLKAGVTYSIPTDDYSLVVEGPAGREELDAVAVVTRENWDWRFYGRFDRDRPFPDRPEGPKELMRSLREGGIEEEPAGERERDSYRSEGESREKGLRPEERGEAQGIRIRPNPNPPSYNRVARAHTSFEIVRPHGFFWWSHEDEARLRVTSEPDRARVYVEDDYRGVTPVDLDLKPGERSIRVEKEGYHPEVRRVRIEEGDRSKTVRFELEPKVYRYAQ
ncbi:MAG TPA: DUF4384 domain-containing protein [Candidatus Sumerlaeota bacterium]|nr:DUF4384 domain-containing protein [Candidatus Sumerlaeota bacterium]